MRDCDTRAKLEALLDFDPDVAERDEIAQAIRRANQLRGWLDAALVRCKRRLDELNALGRSESAGQALMDEGRRSGKEAAAIENRERVCSEFPALEDALASGGVSPDHLDVLARLTRNLSDAERSELHSRSDDVVSSATSDWVSEFERKTKSLIVEIKANQSAADEAAELDRQRAESHIRRWTDQVSGMKMTLMALDPLRDAAFHSAVDAQLARLRQDEANAKVPFAQLQVEAVIAAVSAGEPTMRVPEVVVHIDAESVANGRHEHTLCETVDGVALPVSTVQRLCCEAVLTAVIVDADGTVTRLTEEVRTANRQQRRALAAMYSTCAHPHCTVGFGQCRMHHIVWWSKGGKTLMVNLLPLCETHHHLVHEGGWQLTMTPDRTCTWIRPDGTIWLTHDSINRAGRRSGRTSDRPPRPPGAAPPSPPANWRQPSLC